MASSMVRRWLEGKCAQFNRQNYATWVVLILLALWLLRRPYLGLQHDSALYMFQTLAVGNKNLLDDLYFSHGVQQGYTVFQYLVHPLVRLLGKGWAAMVVTLVGGAAWIAGFCVLASRTLPKTAVPWALVCVACLSRFYGGSIDGSQILGVGEPFATPRVFSEAAVMAALGYAYRYHHAPCVLWLAVASLFHPLVALSGIAITTIWYLLRYRIMYLCIAIGIALVFGLAANDIRPFHLLTKIYDDWWWRWVVSANGWFVMPTRWAIGSWTYVALDASLIAAAMLLCRRVKMRRWLLVSTTVVTSLVLMSMIIGDGFRNVFVVASQLWRALWIAHVFALMCFGYLMMHAVQRLSWPRLSILGTFLLAYLLMQTYAGLALCMAALLLLMWQDHVPKPKLPIGAWRLTGILLFSISALTLLKLSVEKWSEMSIIQASPQHVISAVLLSGGVLCVVMFSVLYVCVKRSLISATGATLFSLIVLLVSTMLFDRRGPWEKALESDWQHPVLSSIPPSSSVYWVRSPALATGLLLQRSAFIDDFHATNILFSRDFTVEFERRAASVRKVNISLGQCSAQNSCFQEGSAFHDLCRAEPGLDFVILSDNAAVKWGPEFSLSAYECQKARK
jgi:hypothetical protein